MVRSSSWNSPLIREMRRGSMATRKIPETLNFAEGLLKLAAEADNVIGSPGISPRDILTQCGTGALSDLRPDILEPLGVYQGRAVLVVLAA
jgi:hypothetical protein